MTRTVDIILESVLLIAGIGFLSMTFDESFRINTFGGDVGPAFAPRLFLIAWIAFAAMALIQAIRSEPKSLGKINVSQFAAVVIIALITAFAMTRIGFVFATIPGFAAFCWAFGYHKPAPLLLVSVSVPLGIWALFTFAFELLLPHSPWFSQI